MAYISKFTGKQFDEAVSKVGTLETTVANKADASVVTALSAEVKKKEATANKVTSISATSTDTQYPSAKAVYKSVNGVETTLGLQLGDLQNWREQYPNAVNSALSAKEDSANKTTTVASSSTDTQYPTAKAVYTAINNLQGSSSESVTSVSNRVKTLEGLNVKKVTTGLADTVQDAWQLVDGNGKAYGVTIQTYKDRSVESVSLDGQNLNITYNLANGAQSTVSVPLSSFVTESEFNKKTGFSVSKGVVSLNLSTDATSSKYLSFDANGKLQITGIDGKLLGNHNVTSDNLAMGSVTSVTLADDSVTAGKIQNGSIINPKLAANAVATENISANAVTTAKIKDANVTHAKLATDVYDTTLTKASYAADAKAVGDTISPIKISITNILSTIGDLSTITVPDGLTNLVDIIGSILDDLGDISDRLSMIEGTNFIVARKEAAETTLTVAIQLSDDGGYDQTDTIKTLKLADPTVFQVGDRLTAVGIKGYEPSGSVSTNDLILVVKELVSGVGVKVTTTNGISGNGVTNVIPAIPKGTVIRLITE